MTCSKIVLFEINSLTVSVMSENTGFGLTFMKHGAFVGFSIY